MATTTTSEKFSLNLKDFARGALLAVIAAIVPVITASLNAGNLTFDWKSIGVTALAAFFAYLVKNFLTPAEIVIENAPKTQVEKVKNGEAVAKVIDK
jgi:hypothetical protein